MRTLLFIIISVCILVVFHLFRDPFSYVPHTGIGYAFGVLGSLFLMDASRYYFRRKVFNIHRPSRRYLYELHLYFGWWALYFGLLHANFKARGVLPNLLVIALCVTIGIGLMLAWFWKFYYLRGYRLPSPKLLAFHQTLRHLHRGFTVVSLIFLFAHIVRSLK